MKNQNRRYLLKTGAVMGAWTAPLVGSAILPVHAQTSAQNPPMSCALSISAPDTVDELEAGYDVVVSHDATEQVEVMLQVVNSENGASGDVTEILQPGESLIVTIDTGPSGSVDRLTVLSDLCGSADATEVSFTSQFSAINVEGPSMLTSTSSSKIKRFRLSETAY